VLETLIKQKNEAKEITRRMMTNIFLDERKHSPINDDAIMEVLRTILNQDKVATLLGLSKKALLIRRDGEAWSKLRNLSGLGKMKDIELARAIFNAWDAESKGYLSL